MAIGHVAVRPHSRAQGHCVAAAVAYRCGLALTCERTGERYDFKRRAQREDVAGYDLEGGRFNSVGDFAAAVEGAERRKNARICRDVQVALPAELDEPSRIKLTQAFAAELAERYRTAVCWAVHRPDRRSDQRNHHAHILLPTRALAADGRTFGEKLRVLDDQRSGPEEITVIRQLWEALANEALIAAGQEATVHTGRTTNPQPTLGARHTAIERRAWNKRLPGRRECPMSAARLVTYDGTCATGRGWSLARYETTRARHFGRGFESRPVRVRAPEAAQGFAIAVVAVESEPERRPVRPRAPVAAQGFASAIVAVEPEPEPHPVRPPAPVVVRDLAGAVVCGGARAGAPSGPSTCPGGRPGLRQRHRCGGARAGAASGPFACPCRRPGPRRRRGCGGDRAGAASEPSACPCRRPGPRRRRGCGGARAGAASGPSACPCRRPGPRRRRGCGGARAGAEAAHGCHVPSARH